MLHTFHKSTSQAGRVTVHCWQDYNRPSHLTSKPHPFLTPTPTPPSSLQSAPPLSHLDTPNPTPHTSVVRAFPGRNMRASPKSDILSCPEFEMRMFCGLMSRCMRPRLWMPCTPLSSCRMKFWSGNRNRLWNETFNPTIPWGCVHCLTD